MKSHGRPTLMGILDGWQGYNTSLVRAVEPLTAEQLAHRSTADARSVGEIAAHIALGRVDWFSRMSAPGAADLAQRAPSENEIACDAKQIAEWLERSWRMIEENLQRWTVDDLAWSYRQPYQGQVYEVSRQWVVFRILAHDMHHGGQLSELLFQQGITPDDLGWQGGHIVEVPLAEPE